MNETLAVFDGTTIQIQSLEDIWMTQKQMAELYGTTVQNISKHIGKLKQELDSETLSVVINQKLITTQHGAIEGKTQTTETEIYGFEMICQVGYRVSTQKGIKFRQFATKAVTEKVNRDLLDKDEEINQLRIENEEQKLKLGEAVLEISQLKEEVEYQSQFVPDEADYGKIAQNGFPRTTFQKGGFKSRNGRKVQLRPTYIQLDILAISKYLTE